VIGQKLPWVALKDFFAVIKNVSGLIKSILSYRKRRYKMEQIEQELRANYAAQTVSQDDSSYALLRTYVVKRSKQRFEKLSIVRYILRLIMLKTRLQGQSSYFTLSPVFTAIFGLIENTLGLVKLFNLKKRVINIVKFSAERQR